MFSPQGRFIRVFGRSGSGPGEFSAGVRRLFPVAGNQLVIPDPGLGRVQLFSAEGDVEGTRNFEFRDGKPVSWGADPVAASDELVIGLRMLPDPEHSPGGKLTLIRLRVTDWTVTDSLSISAGSTVGPGAPKVTLLSAEPAWASINDAGIAIGSGDRPEIAVYSWTGLIGQSIKTDRARMAVSSDDQDIVIELFLRQLKSNGLPDAVLREVRKTLAVADFYPLYTRVVSDGADKLWVQLPATAQELQRDSTIDLTARHLGSQQWDVYSLGGDYHGAIQLPAGLTLTWVRGDTLYGIMQAEDGSQIATRYTVIYGNPAPS